MVLQGVAAERRTPYGEGVIDVRIRNVIWQSRRQVMALLEVALVKVAPLGVATNQLMRRDA